MRISEILAQAAEGFGLMRSVERHEVDMIFESSAEAGRFVAWAAQRNLATVVNGPIEVTLFVDG